MQEAKMWEEIEKIKAKERMLATQNNNNSIIIPAVDNGTQQGRVRDIVAEKIGISGSTYKRAKSAVKVIENLPQIW